MEKPWTFSRIKSSERSLVHTAKLKDPLSAPARIMDAYEEVLPRILEASNMGSKNPLKTLSTMRSFFIRGVNNSKRVDDLEGSRHISSYAQVDGSHKSHIYFNHRLAKIGIWIKIENGDLSAEVKVESKAKRTSPQLQEVIDAVNAAAKEGFSSLNDRVDPESVPLEPTEAGQSLLEEFDES